MHRRRVCCRLTLDLIFDRPFLFAVVHEPTGLVLFCGEVLRPEKWEEPGAPDHAPLG